MHPEVIYISFLTSLYAGITLLYFKYFIILNHIVKKRKYRSLSAGNNKIDTSETTCDEFLKNISVHVPKHQKPFNIEQLGHYLAGLIDGDGHFSKIKLG